MEYGTFAFLCHTHTHRSKQEQNMFQKCLLLTAAVNAALNQILPFLLRSWFYFTFFPSLTLTQNEKTFETYKAYAT